MGEALGRAAEERGLNGAEITDTTKQAAVVLADAAKECDGDPNRFLDLFHSASAQKGLNLNEVETVKRLRIRLVGEATRAKKGIPLSELRTRDGRTLGQARHDRAVVERRLRREERHTPADIEADGSRPTYARLLKSEKDREVTLFELAHILVRDRKTVRIWLNYQRVRKALPEKAYCCNRIQNTLRTGRQIPLHAALTALHEEKLLV